MSGQQVAYKRVSSADQNLDRQLVDVNIEFNKVFEEKISGSIKERPELTECLSYVRDGDTLHVHSIDRLARDMRHLLEMVDALNARGVTVKFHKENLTFTNQHTPMEKLMLQMLGGFAEFERMMIRERQREGIEIARKQGRFIGRKPIDQEIRARVIKLREDKVNAQVIADACNIAISSVYNIIREGNTVANEQ